MIKFKNIAILLICSLLTEKVACHLPSTVVEKTECSFLQKEVATMPPSQSGSANKHLILRLDAEAEPVDCGLPEFTKT